MSFASLYSSESLEWSPFLWFDAESRLFLFFLSSALTLWCWEFSCFNRLISLSYAVKSFSISYTTSFSLILSLFSSVSQLDSGKDSFCWCFWEFKCFALSFSWYFFSVLEFALLMMLFKAASTLANSLCYCSSCLFKDCLISRNVFFEDSYSMSLLFKT